MPPVTREQLTAARLRLMIDAGELDEPALRALADDPRVTVRNLARRALARLDAAAAERARLDAMLSYERELWGRGLVHVAGLDEVGVGPLAGPVVAAAVILPAGASIDGIDDSKRLDPPTRAALAGEVRARAVAWAIGTCSPEEIEELNIYHAALEAMRRAAVALSPVAEHLLVDARVVPRVIVPQTAIVKGDARSQTIAAASVIAKVHRDALMEEMGRLHPGYGFEEHAGYPTPAHLEALRRLGPCPIHRRSFGPVAELIGG